MSKGFCVVCGRESDGLDDAAVCTECSGSSAAIGIESGTVLAGAGRSFATVGSVPVGWVPVPGDVLLDLYEVQALLGEGGMGTVHRVRHRGWGLDLAVKSPKPGVEGFAAEAEAWVDLGLHPHIVTCHYVRSLGGVPRVFAELVVGGSLKDWIGDGRLYAGDPGVVLGRLLDVAIQFAWGLGYAHDQGLVHQDVKPANVLLTSDGVVKVTDFGLAVAKPVEIESGPIGTRVVAGVGGTEAYMSPEQADAMAQARAEVPIGERTVLSRRTDVWSWGLSVLEMFVGERTWTDGQAAPHVLEQYVRDGSERDSVPAMPEDLIELLGECFQQDPDDRPHDFDQISSNLVAIYAEAAGTPFSRSVPDAVELRADALNNRALSLLDLGREDAAEAAWQEALKIDPHHPEATVNHALRAWRIGAIDYEEIVRRLDAVAAARRNAARPHLLLARVHLERGDPSRARSSLRTASRLGGDPGQIDAATEAIRSLPEQVPPGTLPPVHSAQAAGVMGIAAHPDGSRVVTLDEAGVAHTWDPSLERIGLSATEASSQPSQGARLVFSPVVTPDGRLVIFGDAEHGVCVRDTETGALVHVMRGHESDVRTTAALGDHLAASGSDDETARIWDLRSGEAVRVLEHETGVTALAPLPGGRIVTGGWQGAIRVWDVGSGALLQDLCHGPDDAAMFVNGLAVFPDGSRMVSGGRGTVRIWDVDSGECLQVIEGLMGGVGALLMHPGGSRLAAADMDTVRVYEVGSGRLLRTIHSTGYPPRLTDDGRFLFVVADEGSDTRPFLGDRYQVWDFENLHHVTSLKGRPSELCVITGDGTHAVSVGYGPDVPTGSPHHVRVWELDFGAVRADWAVCRPRSAVDVAKVSERVLSMAEEVERALDGGRAAAAAAMVRDLRVEEGYEHDPELSDLWHRTGLAGGRRTGLLASHCLHTFTEHEGDPATAVAVSSDGRLVAAAGDVGCYWDLETGKSQPIGDADSVAFTPGGARIVVANWVDNVRVWDVANADCAFEMAHQAHLLSVAPHGYRGLTGSSDGTIRIWDLYEGDAVGEWTAEYNPGAAGGRRPDLSALAISPDGTWGLLGQNILLGPRTVTRVDLASGSAVDAYQTLCTYDIVIVADGQRAAFLAAKGIELWKLDPAKLLWRVAGYRDMAACADGRFAVTGYDQAVRVLDLERGEECVDLTGHEDVVWGVAITPDGRTAVSGSEDGVVKVWKLDWEYEFPKPVDWDEGARSYLEIFLTLHTPYGPDGLSRVGVPVWSGEDFQQLLTELGWRGYGWLRPEGVRAKLEELAVERGRCREA